MIILKAPLVTPEIDQKGVASDLTTVSISFYKVFERDTDRRTTEETRNPQSQTYYKIIRFAVLQKFE